MKQILSPLQLKNFKENLKDKLDIAKGISELISIHQKFLSKMEEMDNLVNKKVGPPGPPGPASRIPGPPGEPGKSPDVNEIVKYVQARIKIPKNGTTPQKGVHYFTHDEILHVAKLAANFVKTDKARDVEIDPMKIIEAIEKLPAGKRLTSSRRR